MFKVTPVGGFTLLHSFSASTTDGGYPNSSLVQGTDSNFYSTTYGGGATGSGIVFKITASGTFTLLHSFTSATDGKQPNAGLVQGADGNFYGTAENGGATGYGTAFKISSAGAFTLLHSFSTATTDGQHPYAALVLGTDGNFYGTTANGGAVGYGSAFKITAAGTLTLLHSFSTATSDGYYPYDGLVQGADGNFYGTTYEGGSATYGVIYKITNSPAQAGPVALSVPSSVNTGASFTLTSSIANAYSATLQQCFATNTAGDATGWTGVKTSSATAANTTLTAPTSAGTYTYTLTCGGMESSSVTLNVVSFAPTSATVSSVTTIADSTTGVTVTATESGAEGVVTGGVVTFTTKNGSSLYGSFSPTTCTLSASGSCTTTYFANPNNTLNPSTYSSAIIANFAANNAYTAISAQNSLTIVPATPTVTISPIVVPALSTAGVTVKVTESGSAGSISFNQVTFGVTSPATGSFSPAMCDLYSGSCTTTFYPTGSLAPGTYVNDITASFPAANNYAAASATSNLTISPESVVVNFTGTGGAAPGANPGYGNLIQASDGNFYGTTVEGGANGQGTVFKVSAGGGYTLLHSFTTGSDGEQPEGGLVQGTDGSFYGTTSAGGDGGSGTVFKITSSGAFTLLYTFSGNGDGDAPYASLVQGTDGNFYGTAVYAGDNNAGVAFKITPGGTFTVLHQFSGSGTDGVFPYAGLVQGADGNFYGTTSAGGVYDQGNGADAGTVYQLTPGGAFTVLHSFQHDGSDGYEPNAGLVQGTDGNFYGTTVYGGPNQYGTVFKITPGGNLTVLHSFSGGADGYGPQGGLVQGTDGNFYGTTYYSGPSQDGTAFKIDASGNFTLLYEFSGNADGGTPLGGLVQGADGNFYGLTSIGGTQSDGNVFKLISVPVSAGPVALSVPASVGAGSSFALTYSIANAYSATLKQCFATNTAGDTTGWKGIRTGGPSGTNATLIAPTNTGTYTYTLTCGGMESGSVALSVVPPVAPTVSVSAINTSVGSSTGVTVTATESGSAGSEAGGVVTFSVVSPATGSFSPATCTLGSAGTCTTTYLPTGTLGAGTYTNDVMASFVGVGSYSAASATSTLTVAQGTPAATLSTSAGMSAADSQVTLTASIFPSNGLFPSGKVSFVTSLNGGSATAISGCTSVSTVQNTALTATCSTTTLQVGSNSISATIAADANFTSATSAPLTVKITAVAPAVTVSSITAPYQSTAGVTVTATEVGSAGTASGTMVTFIVQSPATGSFSPTSCTIASGSCTVTYYPTGSLAAGNYNRDVLAIFSAANAYASATAISALVIIPANPTITWNPSSVTGFQGEAIGAGVLDAQASTAGSFSYSVTNSANAMSAITPASTLTAGAYTLTATFNPANTTSYTGASSSLGFTVDVQSVFIANSSGSVASFFGDGGVQSGATNNGGIGAAVDASGYVWSINSGGNGISKFNDAGAFSSIYIGLGTASATAIAIGGLDNVFVTNGNGTINALTNAGTALFSKPVAAGVGILAPTAMSVDSSGSLWIASSGDNSAVEIIGVAAPVVAPTVNAVKNANPGTRP